MSDLTTTETPASACKHCGHVCDRASHGNGAVPSPGDMSICFNCGTIHEFDENLNMQLPDAETMVALRTSRPVTYKRMIEISRDLAIRHKSKAKGFG